MRAVAVAVLVRLSAWWLLPAGRFASDEDSYYRVGTTLLATGEQDLFWPPFTGWIIATVAWLLHTTDIRWIRLAWIAMDIGCVLTVRALALRLGRSAFRDEPRARRIATVAAFAYALYLPAISFAQFTTSETPALLLLLLALTLLAHHTLTTGAAIGAGLLLGCVCITRPSLLPLAIVLPGARLLLQPSREVAWRTTLAVLMSTLVVGAVIVRHYTITGVPTIAQNSAYNLYIGNRDLYAEDLDLFSPVATPGQIEFRRQFWSGELTYPTLAPEELQREALAWIVTHPQQFARRVLGRLARVFAPKTDVLELLGGERQAGIFSVRALSVLAIANAQWLIVLFGGLVGVAGLVRREHHLGTLFAATVLGSLPLCLIAISKPRYAFTFEPVLLLGAVYFFSARAEVRAGLTRGDRWLLGALSVFVLWGWTAWIVFAVSSRVGLTSAP